MHPNLNFDLLKAQIDAAHEIGVKAVVYLSAGYDEKFAAQHKDCVVRNQDGTTNFIKSFDEPGFHWLCMNTPYLEHLLNQIREVLENYEFEGLFLDGGKILASGKSCTDKDGRAVLDLGLKKIAESQYNPCYCRPNFKLKSLDNSAYLVSAECFVPQDVTGEVYAVGEYPYFNRTTEHFCSHMHAPNNPDQSFSAIVGGKDGIYIGYNIFEEYAKVGSITAKEIVMHLIDELLTDKSVTTNLPAQGVITLAKQKNRDIVHLLYASPVKRGKNVEIIEDIMPVCDTWVHVKCENNLKRVYLAPQNKDIDFKKAGNTIEFTVDKFECHQMIVLEY